MENTNVQNPHPKHYICLGGCKGVSKVPGLCTSPNCANHEHNLVPCDCEDDKHHEFKAWVTRTNIQTNPSLTQQKCIPCEGGVTPFSKEEVGILHKQIPSWNVSTDAKSIFKSYIFQNFKEALTFINKVGALAELEGHHPDIYLKDYKFVELTLSTHAISGLSQNDFILAAKIDTQCTQS